MLPKSGVIYLSEKMPDGSRVTIEVEQTPDDLTSLPAFKDQPREELASIAFTPVPAPQRDRFTATSSLYPHLKSMTTGSPWNGQKRPVSSMPAQYRPPAVPARVADSRGSDNTVKTDARPSVGFPVMPAPVTASATATETPASDIPADRSQPQSEPNADQLPMGAASLPPAVTLPYVQAADTTREARASARHPEASRKSKSWRFKAGMALVALSLGGITAPLIPKIRLETAYRVTETKASVAKLIDPPKALPKSVPLAFDPMIAPDGTKITPVNTDFSVIIPRIGVNAPVIAGVNPGDPGRYAQALKKGVAQSSTSFLPSQDGTVYLFSHSTNYDWFVKDLNAVFYLLKNLEPGDYIVLYYKNVRYTYQLKEKRVVKPNEVAYLVPNPGEKKLILQTCWPPGSTTERLLLFADLVDEQGQSI